MRKFAIIALLAALCMAGIASESEARCRRGGGRVATRGCSATSFGGGATSSCIGGVCFR